MHRLEQPYRIISLVMKDDSVCIDSDDNLYVAMYGQGRVLVFNKRGYPIGQILMPGRDEGKMLRSTHPQFIRYKSIVNMYQ